MGLLRKISDQQYEVEWHIAIRRGAPGDIFQRPDDEWHVIENDGEYWVADPFVFTWEGKCYLFAEWFDLKEPVKKQRGRIRYTVYDPKTGRTDGWKPAFGESFHMSFPFLYQEGDTVYLLPETSHSGSMVRYKAIHFPDVWEKEILLSGVEMVDCALYSDGGGYQGFGTQTHGNGPSDFSRKARLFTLRNGNVSLAEDFFSDDQRICRLGGAFIETESHMLRVAQNCENSYGESLILIEWDRENRRDIGILKEIHPSELKLDRKIAALGIHTYNAYGGFEVIDIKSRNSNLYRGIQRLGLRLEDKLRKGQSGKRKRGRKG